MSITHDTTFDIVGFIEKNPLTRLSSSYQHILIKKIKRDFNPQEQKIYVTSLYSYLNFNSLTDFIIDFDDVRKWCGYSRKDHAKRVLEKHFVIDVDYTVITPPIGGVIKEKGGAHRKEKISLNILTFKKFCLKSDTKKSDEIHNYYIKLETILHETLKATKKITKELARKKLSKFEYVRNVTNLHTLLSSNLFLKIWVNPNSINLYKLFPYLS